MELRHLRYFCALADFGTFSKASQHLHISQSAISEQIADLEQEIGGALLDRSQRRTRLTPQGLMFLAEARRTLLASERAIDLTRRSLKGELGTLSIGFFPWGTRGFFARIIREYRRLCPQVRLSLYEMHASVQMEALTSGKIDIGFTRPLEAPFSRTLRAELLYRDPVVVALPSDHPLAGRSLDIAALAGEPFVMCDRTMTPVLFDNILALCTTAGYSPRIVNTTSTWSGVLTLVESGEGIAMVPSGARTLRTRGVAFAELKPTTLYTGISVAWNPSNENPIQADFLRLVMANKERIHRTGGN
ncbi:MAG TPA: LysR family transcriptional regulator [Granulicella sp.]|jgi:DNA-binding transcriptional LysR family regulator|nr:LysR family transcriptional regulator [Granulicella sp.]